MSQAARAPRARARADSARTKLRVVPAPVARRPRRARRSAESACRSVFTTLVAILIALTSLGLARVAVIARAAEMTISADQLARRIKAQRIETDQLEIDRSSLSTPSRIEGLAADTMRMGDPASVSYMEMPATPADGATELADARVPSAVLVEAAPSAPSAAERVKAVFATLIDVSAGEAQSLLVGDFALVGSR
jgi:cell division protein FtsL